MSVPGKQVQNGTYEFDDYMRVPVIKTRWETVRDAIYDPAEGTFCGKTGKKWGITGIFYTLFFCGLAIFCAICYKGLAATLDEKRPTWILDSGLIGTNPGLGFRPLPPTEQRSMIWYSGSNETQVKSWISRVDTFLDNYKSPSKLPNEGRNQQICSFERPKTNPNNVCAVNVHSWGACSPEQSYGFNHSAPCIFIKLNRIYGWIPEYYNNSAELPSDMPEQLVTKIKKTNSTAWLNTVWVSCQGADPFDRENIGEIEYYPESQGFPGYYYPYENDPGYLSPLVAVHFKRPKREVGISVQCRAWAKNIKFDPIFKLGMVHFELLID